VGSIRPVIARPCQSRVESGSKRGEQVVERRVGSGDFVTTLYHHLGIDPTGISFNNLTGRPIPIFTEGAPIPELSA
jgi:hypothetical protein